ncbi:hypothetical protein DFA_09385 [Cavenderia fasciculata]|uniref:Uncharacterized protein n=1 Tax=Cavenderia fasciculata TaxID=261658 RepID=F4Q7H2_CACFS|nr:uncharacterized protein DFA_09385 [Cavenderia fasciculata]EGG16354.1 hypothetical protein DFA_09385 [Cavenderia fasciculata]|eukprot:XP_004354738.1 hypothetical protein DFA_09385 [Cavenderia fasciculata]
MGTSTRFDCQRDKKQDLVTKVMQLALPLKSYVLDNYEIYACSKYCLLLVFRVMQSVEIREYLKQLLKDKIDELILLGAENEHLSLIEENEEYKKKRREFSKQIVESHIKLVPKIMAKIKKQYKDTKTLDLLSLMTLTNITIDSKSLKEYLEQLLNDQDFVALLLTIVRNHFQEVETVYLEEIILLLSSIMRGPKENIKKMLSMGYYEAVMNVLKNTTNKHIIHYIIGTLSDVVLNDPKYKQDLVNKQGIVQFISDQLKESQKLSFSSLQSTIFFVIALCRERIAWETCLPLARSVVSLYDVPNSLVRAKCLSAISAFKDCPGFDMDDLLHLNGVNIIRKIIDSLSSQDQSEILGSLHVILSYLDHHRANQQIYPFVTKEVIDKVVGIVEKGDFDQLRVSIDIFSSMIKSLADIDSIYQSTFLQTMINRISRQKTILSHQTYDPEMQMDYDNDAQAVISCSISIVCMMSFGEPHHIDQILETGAIELVYLMTRLVGEGTRLMTTRKDQQNIYSLHIVDAGGYSALQILANKDRKLLLFRNFNIIEKLNNLIPLIYQSINK